MKRILFAVAVLALLVPAARRAEAATDVSIDFFYDNLNDGGNWIDVADYGYCWQPTIAVSNKTWRPYSDGYWAYTDVGWTWVSYEDFGWATYHYGRWIRLRGRGWAWVPGRDWGPAWVSWRTGGDYVGWAPLPPRRPGDIFVEFSPINSRVDIDFDIGPAYYNFIDIRFIGEPVLRERIFAPDQNVTYMTKTVNVTNITYTNSTVYNYGPDFDTLSRYSARPIQRLSVQRETSVDPAAAAQSKSLMRVQGDKLVVAAPRQFQKPAQTVAPKIVKEKITQAPLDRGWERVADQKAQADLKAKMQKEDPKSVPPTTIQASEKNPSTSLQPATTSEKKDKRIEKPAPPAAAPMPMQNSVVPPTPPPVRKPESADRSKRESPRDRAVLPPTSHAPANPPGKDDGKRQKKNEPATAPSP